MFSTKLIIACTVLFVVSAIGASTGLFAYQRLAEAVPTPQRIAKADEDKKELKKLDEKAQKAARQRSKDSMQKLMEALHKYDQINDHFPPAAIYDKSGKPLLSWRVLLLPYLDQDDLFAQFHLDEPWDSKHNKPLLAKMPKQYAPPLPDKTKEKNATFYQVFTGKGTVFDGAEGISLTSITDGTSNTITLVEAAEAVPWSKPVDLPYDAKKPLPKLGGLFDHGFHAALADGSVHWFKKDFDVRTMRLAITRNDGFPLDLDKLKADQ